MVRLWTLLILLGCNLPSGLAQVDESPAVEVIKAEEGSGVAGSDEPGLLIERLSPLNQIRVFTGLFTVIVLGVVIFIVIKAGAHMARGLAAAANRLPQDSSPKQDDWADTPLVKQPVDSELAKDSAAEDTSSNDASE